MSLITELEEEVKEAMLARDTERRDALRLILSSLRSAEKVGRDDVVLVDRPGRGYGADYSPWLVDAPVGELVRVRAAAVTAEGLVAT